MENHFSQPDDEDRIMQPDSENIALPADLEEKVVQQLKDRSMIIPSRPWFTRTWVKAAASILIVMGIFVTGYFTGKNSFVSKPIASTSSQEFLLLLYNPPDFIPDQRHVKEYGAWMKSINNADVSASGQELNDHAWTIEKNNTGFNIEEKPISGEFGPLSGFFLLRTPSPERALEIAASCPHVKYNGVVELRPIQQH